MGTNGHKRLLMFSAAFAALLFCGSTWGYYPVAVDGMLTNIMGHLTSPFDNRELYLIDENGGYHPMTHAEEIQVRSQGAELARDNALLRAYSLPVR